MRLEPHIEATFMFEVNTETHTYRMYSCGLYSVGGVAYMYHQVNGVLYKGCPPPLTLRGNRLLPVIQAAYKGYINKLITD